MVGRRGEDPRSQPNAIGKTAGPAFGTRLPQLDRLTPEGEPPCPTRLGRPKYIGRDAALDTEHTLLEIVETQCHQLAAPSARVRSQTHEEANLLGLVPTLGVPRIRGNDERLGRFEQPNDLFGAEMEPRTRTWRSAHAAERVDVDNAFDVRPSESRAQHTKATRDHGHRGARKFHAAMAARTCSGLSVDTRRTAKGSAVRALTLERAPIHVAGRQS